MKIFSNPNATLKSKYGQYQIAVLGSIVGVSAEGIADGSAIERYARDMMDVINSLGGNHWAFLGFCMVLPFSLKQVRQNCSVQ